MNALNLLGGLGELRAQWQQNTRLRALLWLVLTILWLWLLLVAGDAVQAARQRTATIADEIERLRPLAREDNRWPERAAEARQHVEALRGMLWTEADAGLAEAAFQDWVRATASKAGLRLRELSLAASAAALAPAAGASGPASPSGSAGARPLRLRMVVEWSRVEALAFLAEVGRSERVVVVERLQWRSGTPGSTAEIDLRALTSAPAAPGGTR